MVVEGLLKGFRAGLYNRASWRAAGGVQVLERAERAASLDAALQDCVLVAATSARDRRIPWPLRDARAAAQELLAATRRGPVAVVFGRETSGLTNEELHRAHLHIQIPSDPTYGVLNVAMAVQVIAYELRAAALGAGAEIREEWDQPLATAADQERLLEHLATVLELIDYYDPNNPRQALTRLRRLVLRARLDEVEVRMLRGILRLVEAGFEEGG